MNILETLAAAAEKRVAENKKICSLAQIKEQAKHLPGDFRFVKALSRSGISLICEVKKASPSKGIISQDFPYAEIVRDYEAGGADCLSVLTEPTRFLGSDDIFRDIRAKTELPMLRKDFTVDEYQLYEARLLGADAVLLICALLDTQTIARYIGICDALGMNALVETHCAQEIDSAVRAGARIIGVNNRNLADFSVDLESAGRLREKIPRDVLFVAESGVSSLEDAARLAAVGADALLVGEFLMRAEDRARAVRELRAACGNGGAGA